MNSLPSRAKSDPLIDFFLRTAQRGFHNPRFDEEAQVADVGSNGWRPGFSGFQKQLSSQIGGSCISRNHRT